jgi:pimeloyl-ACP methyl ester carboxylesterase
VLLHGLASAATSFGPVLAAMHKASRRVVAPDYPGHGFSSESRTTLTPRELYDAATEALDALVDEPALVVGHSLGGAVALHYALRRPSKVKAIALVSPAGARGSDEEWNAIRKAFDVASRSDARRFLQRLYDKPPWFMPLLAHEIPAMLGRRAVRDLLETATNDDLATPEALGSLAMPVLLLWGSSERLLPQAHFEYFARHLPAHAVIERPAGFGHCPHFDAPGALAKRIVEFGRGLGA